VPQVSYDVNWISIFYNYVLLNAFSVRIKVIKHVIYKMRKQYIKKINSDLNLRFCTIFIAH
jgi:hypothetical protein